MTSRMEWAQCLPSPLLLLSMKLSVIKLGAREKHDRSVKLHQL